MRWIAGLFFLIILGLNPGVAAEETAGGCRHIASARALDFWIGHWDVAGADGSILGTSRVVSILGGCAVTEEWTGVSGFEGRSLFYFDSWLPEWRQVWITALPRRAGSIKEKRMVERFSDGGVRFRGEVMVSPEHYVQDRTSLRPLPDGRVHQLIEWSNDDGRTWHTGFEGWYSPREH